MSLLMSHNQRIYIDDLIVGREYYVIDKWMLDNSRRRHIIYFQGAFVQQYPWYHHSDRAEFYTGNSIKVVNTHNEFYLVHPSMDPKLRGAIYRRAALISNPKLSLDQIQEIQYNPRVVLQQPEEHFSQDTIDLFSLSKNI